MSKPHSWQKRPPCEGVWQFGHTAVGLADSVAEGATAVRTGELTITVGAAAAMFLGIGLAAVHALGIPEPALDGVREILVDPARTSVRLVVNPERMVIAEARRTSPSSAATHISCISFGATLAVTLTLPWPPSSISATAVPSSPE